MSFAKPGVISIITVCRNAGAFLEQTIASVLGQDYPALEYLVVDGGSTDASLEIVQRYAAQDPRLRWISEPDGGIADAMNKGASLAGGEILCHLHADDYFAAADVLTRVAASFSAHPGALWLTGGARLVGPRGDLLTEIPVRDCTFSLLKRVNCVLHPATFIRRETFLKLGGFDTTLRYAMDYHLWLRLAPLGEPLRLQHPLACFRIHPGSLSVSRSEEAFAEEHAIRRRFWAGSLPRTLFNELYYQVMKRVNRHAMARLRKAAAAGEGVS